MIPILYNADITTDPYSQGHYSVNNSVGTFLVNGVISCVVTEERNGIYELKMVFNTNDEQFKEIELWKVIFIKANDTDVFPFQLFRIYRITKPINNRSTIYAEHISYRMSQIPVRAFDLVNADAQTALNTLKSNAMISCPFTFTSDITTMANYSVTEPSSLKSKLVGEEGSILQVYGGEYKYDNFTVSLLQNRGENNGVQLLYGKNITDLTQEEKISETYSGICPFWKGNQEGTDTEIVVTLPEEIVYTDNHESFPYEKIMPVDLSDKFEDQPTTEQLRTAANTYIIDNDIGTPDVSIDVSFIPVWQASGYEEFEELEHVSLCDTVTVIFEKLGIEVEAKVVKTVYDCLKERYSSISIGKIKQNFTNKMNDELQNLQTVNTKNQKAIKEVENSSVNKSGDAMTGNLTIRKQSPQVLQRSTDINSAVGQTVPSSGEAIIGGMQIGDNQGYNVGWFRIIKNNLDRVYAAIVARRNVSGTDITNYLNIGVNADGTKYVSVTESAPWRTALGLPTHIEDRGTGTATVYSGSGVINNSTSIQKRSGVAIATVIFQVPAGTYNNTKYLLTFNPAPINTTRCILSFGSSNIQFRLDTSGRLFVNDTITVSATVYVLGQIVYAY